MHAIRQVAMPLIAAVALALSGCAGEPASNLTSNAADGPGYEVIEDPLEYFGEMTTLNGERPDGELLPLQDVDIMLNTIDADGNRLLVERGVRKAGPARAFTCIKMEVSLV